ncbi:M4 family metallopeptidase [Nocardioides sp. TF02-7]|uniref:protealysin inhibitor emfourin n=1 Tax=Nocardioides sp. TF02-7 TaxID=2917724 RepID=UPI001F056B2A|nr:M4 family metallopeptidase [Nocardioides sp. TF02-7]UMG94476.1 M4 family metallopeptidase [Nocardioides sp. TF02-7]
MHCPFVPAYLLERLAAAGHGAGGPGRTVEVDARLRARRASLADPRRAQVSLPTSAVPGDAAPAWQVHTAGGTARLPGDLVRPAGGPESGDAAVDEAALGLTESLALLADLGRSSYDGRGATVVATVHYERDYDNAFWNGTQLVFGDGDGRVFDRFTKPIDVLGHELGHALTQHTADLAYAGQAGALNESVSDVVGACVRQRHLGQDVSEADWLVGVGLFLPGVQARALRSMAEPGTAYDDPVLGRDPQPGHMDDYVDTDDDNGGVHINSGIPNKAFHLAATAIGGTAWEGAGRIWFTALTSGIGPQTDFAGFAEACVAAAGQHATAVAEAWQQVGVVAGRGGRTRTVGGAGAAGPGWPLTVRRSGGYAGLVSERTVDLDGDDEVAARARRLFEAVDLEALRPAGQHPDAFVYTFACGPVTARLGEQDLTPELVELARLVLGADDR